MDTLTLLEDARLWKDPAGTYRAMHALGPKIFANPHGNGLVAIGYTEIETLTRTPAFQAVNRDSRGAHRAKDGPLAWMLGAHPHFQNEPDHMGTRRRAFGILSGGSAQAVQSRVDRILAEVLRDLPAGHADLVTGLCVPLASRLWSDILTGSTEHADLLADCSAPLAAMMAFDTPEDALPRADAGGDRLMVWCHAHLPDEDAMIAAAMTFDAIDGAGAMLANALWLLAGDAALQDRLRADPKAIGAFWNEATRLVPSVLGLERSPVAPITVDGHEIPPGTNVLLLNAAGNRDPRSFAAPDALDLTRKGPPTLSFGFGPRACAGRFLARLAGESAIAAMLQRGAFTLTSVAWCPPGQLRTPTRLTVTDT